MRTKTSQHRAKSRRLPETTSMCGHKTCPLQDPRIQNTAHRVLNGTALPKHELAALIEDIANRYLDVADAINALADGEAGERRKAR